jgi:hypothetical protein
VTGVGSKAARARSGPLGAIIDSANSRGVGGRAASCARQVWEIMRSTQSEIADRTKASRERA